MLPALDGLVLLQTLRGAGNRTPLLLLTALGEVDHRVEGLRAGADDYLVKPFAYAELSARLDDIVRRHRRYHKILRSTQTLSAHDERNDAHEGDTVRVVETRPMSRTKRWRLVEVVERAR